MKRFLLELTLLALPFLGFTQQTNSTKVCMVVKETLMGPIVCFVPCEKTKGGKNNGMAPKDVAR